MSDRQLRIKESGSTFMPITVEFYIHLDKDLSIEFDHPGDSGEIAVIPKKKVQQLIDFLLKHYPDMMDAAAYARGLDNARKAVDALPHFNNVARIDTIADCFRAIDRLRINALTEARETEGKR